MKSSLKLQNFQRILVISLTNLGDVILTTPVLAVLKKIFPQAILSVLVGPKAEELFQRSKTVDEMIIYDKRRLNGWRKMVLVWELRKRNFDLVVDLRNTLIPYLIGTGCHSRFATWGQPANMRERHLARLKFLKLEPTPASFDFFSEADLNQCEKKLRLLGIDLKLGVMVIAPGAGSYLKRWPAERFGEIARHFTDRGKHVVIVGNEEEKKLGDQIQSLAPAANLCGVLSLRELAALLKKSEFVLSCDSAIMHLANEQNVPVVSIFGPTDEKKYGKAGPLNCVVRLPLDCAPCERAHCRLNRQFCMEDLSAEVVTRVCEELFNVCAH